jgi:hypothetical protein
MPTTSPAPKGQAPAPAAAPVSFRRTTQPTVLGTGFNVFQQLGTGNIDLAQWQLPPSNILRCIYLEVTSVAAGNSATVVFNAPDAPLNVFSTVNFTDAGGTSIVGSFSSFELSMAMKYFSYSNSSDPRASAVYSVTTGSGATAGSFNIVFRIPVEVVARTGIAALENTSTNSPLQLNLTLNKSTAIFTTPPTTLPTISVTARLGGYWQGPGGASAPQNFGTTQYINRATVAALNGSVNQQMPNLGFGNSVRNILFENYLNSTGQRNDTQWPNPIEIDFRGNKLVQYSANLWKDEMSRNYGYYQTTQDTALGLDTGVYVLNFNFDFGLEPGAELGNGYLQTNVGDPLTLIGSFGASCNVQYIVNYLAVKGAASGVQASS